MAIPTTDLPGHRHLRDRVEQELGRCQESRHVDFKESAPWNEIQYTIIRTVMAMANLRDGGTIILGVSERDGRWSLAGISSDDLSTYDQDEVAASVAKYASPAVSLQLVLHRDSSGRQFLVMKVEEFDRLPIVCKRDWPGPGKMCRGHVYIRPVGKTETTQVLESEHMHDLIALAAEKEARRILSAADRVGVPLDLNDDESKFDGELGGL